MNRPSIFLTKIKVAILDYLARELGRAKVYCGLRKLFESWFNFTAGRFFVPLNNLNTRKIALKLNSTFSIRGHSCSPFIYPLTKLKFHISNYSVKNCGFNEFSETRYCPQLIPVCFVMTHCEPSCFVSSILLLF